MSKKILFILVIVGLAVTAVMYFKGDQPDAVATNQASGQSRGTDSASPASENVQNTGSGGAITEQARNKTRASTQQNREAYNVLAQKLTAAENTLKRDEFIDQAQQQMEVVSGEVNDALRGNDKGAQKVFNRERECRNFNPMTQMDVETEIDYYQSRFNRRRNVSDEQRAQQDQRITQTRSAMSKRVDSCSWRHTGEFPTLRDQVERQAESGDVLARFYYAMTFKPSPYEVDYLLETAAWSDNSLRFTMENINQGMTVGYLALSLSHAMGIFTHQDARLAGIWGYLVMTCPMRGPIATPYLNSVLSNERMEFLSPTTVDIGQVWTEQICP